MFPLKKGATKGNATTKHEKKTSRIFRDENNYVNFVIDMATGHWTTRATKA
jgi:hypothetical protein